MREQGFSTADYAYDLPKELIAQDPLPDRAASRLMVLDKTTGAVSHHTFQEIASFLRAGDLLILNDTKVIPARLRGVKKDTGAAVELLLLKRVGEKADARRSDDDVAGAADRARIAAEETSSATWECLARPGKKLRVGAEMIFGAPDAANASSGATAPLLFAQILDVLDDGNRLVRFSWEAGDGKKHKSFEELLDALGETPLPPYITHKLDDRDRYNTVYARYDGSAAAPTAGLHFTNALLDDLRAKGVRTATVTLHVGLGTFRPVKVADVREHHMHSEWFQIPEETARLINETKKNDNRVICVGTTSCRTVESAAQRYLAAQKNTEKTTDPASSDDAENLTKIDTGSVNVDCIAPCAGETDIFIYPSYQFLITDALITNFHLPESTLLMLVSAFAGREHVLAAYEEAVRARYRFFSFGDAMLLQ